MTNLLKRRTFIIGTPLTVICFTYLLLSPSTFAKNSNKAALYEDKNGYFAFTPPKGWEMQDFSRIDSSHVIFASPDNAAMIMVLAEPDKYDLESLFFLKKRWVKEHNVDYPNGLFAVKKTAICGFEAVKVDYDIPGIMKKELYFFYFDGVRYDLTYSVRRTEDFAKFRSIALESFSSLEVKQWRIP
jgi:hypothetical protein